MKQQRKVMKFRYMFGTAIVIGAVMSGTGSAVLADSPIEPITDEDIQLNIDSGFFNPDCESYRASVDYLAQGHNAGQFNPVYIEPFSALDVIDYYTIQLNEQQMAVDWGVPSAAMTEEAKALLLGWLHTCGL